MIPVGEEKPQRLLSCGRGGISNSGGAKGPYVCVRQGVRVQLQRLLEHLGGCLKVFIAQPLAGSAGLLSMKANRLRALDAHDDGSSLGETLRGAQNIGVLRCNHVDLSCTERHAHGQSAQHRRSEA